MTVSLFRFRASKASRPSPCYPRNLCYAQICFFSLRFDFSHSDLISSHSDLISSHSDGRAREGQAAVGCTRADRHRLVAKQRKHFWLRFPQTRRHSSIMIYEPSPYTFPDQIHEFFIPIPLSENIERRQTDAQPTVEQLLEQQRQAKRTTQPLRLANYSSPICHTPCIVSLICHTPYTCLLYTSPSPRD